MCLCVCNINSLSYMMASIERVGGDVIVELNRYSHTKTGRVFGVPKKLAIFLLSFFFLFAPSIFFLSLFPSLFLSIGHETSDCR